MDEAALAPLKLPEMDAEAALPLALLEPDAPELPAALPVVPKPEDVAATGVVVTVMPKPVVVAGGVYLTVEGGLKIPCECAIRATALVLGGYAHLEELLLEVEADEPAEPDPELDPEPEADAELPDDEELLVAATLKEPLVA